MEAAAADLIQQVEADQDKTYTLEELQRNIHKNNESAGMRTLRNHLGDDIAFTGVWPDVKDERELEEAELTALVSLLDKLQLRSRDERRQNFCHLLEAYERPHPEES